MELRCHICGCDSLYTLVSGGSYYYQCGKCHTPNVATSWMAVGPELKGIYDITEVDSEMNIIKRLAIGEIANFYDLIDAELHKGKTIWLRHAWLV